MFADPLNNFDLYWLGYIQADGSLVSKVGQEYSPGLYRKKGGYLAFGQIHEEPVIALHAYVEGQGAVKERIHKNTGFKENHSMFLFSSSKPYYALEALGCKSKLRDDIYLSLDFWRGLLDGDGSINFVVNSGRTYPAIAWCGNEYDMVKCADWIESTGLKRPKVGVARSIFRVGLNGEPAAYLTKLLYGNDAYSALPIKHKRALEILKWKTAKRTLSRLTDEQQRFLYGE